MSTGHSEYEYNSGITRIGTSRISDQRDVDDKRERKIGDGTMAKVTRLRPEGYVQNVLGGVRTRHNSMDTTGEASKLGKAIRKAREEHGWTQRELGIRCGYTYGWLSGVERGVSIPTKLMVKRVENALGLEEDALVKIGEEEEVWKTKSRRGDVGDWGMTITEAASYCLVSRTAMYKMVRDGAIEFVQVDKWRRLRITDVAKFILSHAYTAPGPEKAIISLSDLEKDIKEWLKSRRSIN